MTIAHVEQRTDRDAQAQKAYAAAGVTVDKLGEHIGARIGGVTLGGQVPSEQVEAIRLALAINKTVVFTGQHHLDDAGQYAFAELLGEPTQPHPTLKSHGTELLELEGAANSWHTDVTFVDRIPKASILRPVTLPAWGGATTWASTVAAYEQLPKALRALADDLWAVHSNKYDYATESDPKKASGGVSAERRAEYYAEFTHTTYETLHPVVRVHPETGERSLLLAFRPGIPRVEADRIPAAVPAAAEPNHPAGEHLPLELEPRRRRDLGQPGHPALRHRGFRRSEARVASGHAGRRCSRQRDRGLEPDPHRRRQ